MSRFVTLDTLFLLLVTTYLVLISYGVVGARRRLTGGALLLSLALLAVLPPLLIALALLASGEAALVARWARSFVAMTIAGAGVVVAAMHVARRVDG